MHRPERTDVATTLALFAPPSLEEHLRAYVRRLRDEVEASGRRGDLTPAAHMRCIADELHEILAAGSQEGRR